jgi:acetyltransferase-like isoleucine patch superfamily enzyme
MDLRYYKRCLSNFLFKLEAKIYGVYVGKHTVRGKSVGIKRKNLIIGDYCYIGQYTYLCSNLTIGNFCLISDQVNFIGSDHNINIAGIPVILSGVPENVPITVIEDDVWIGHGVTIMRGVTVGRGSIVASNAVVTKDVKAYSVVGGIPAKELKKRFIGHEINIHDLFLEQYKLGKIQLSHDRKFQPIKIEGELE